MAEFERDLIRQRTLAGLAAARARGRAGGWSPDNMEDQGAVERAEILVERINGPVLLISGQDDAMWPSTRLAEIARRRLEQHNFRHAHRHLAYPGAGHMIGTPYVPSTTVASRHPLTAETPALGPRVVRL